MPRKARDHLIRVRSRPHPQDWGDDDSMTLIEAVAVFFPHGPLTLSSFRTEIAAGRLEVARVAGKDLTTPRAIRKLVTPCRAGKPNRLASGVGQTMEPGSSSIEDGKCAQASAALKLKALRARSKPTLAHATSLPSAPAIPLRSPSQT